MEKVPEGKLTTNLILRRSARQTIRGIKEPKVVYNVSDLGTMFIGDILIAGGIQQVARHKKSTTWWLAKDYFNERKKRLGK